VQHRHDTMAFRVQEWSAHHDRCYSSVRCFTTVNSAVSPREIPSDPTTCKVLVDRPKSSRRPWHASKRKCSRIFENSGTRRRHPATDVHLRTPMRRYKADRKAWGRAGARLMSWQNRYSDDIRIIGRFDPTTSRKKQSSCRSISKKDDIWRNAVAQRSS